MTRADQLAEAISGWRLNTPQAQRKRELALARKRALTVAADQARPFTIAEIVTEVELLWGTDTADNIAARLRTNPRNLSRRLYANGHRDLAARFERHAA